MAAHLKHADAISPDMFARWLLLWRDVTAELFAPDIARDLQDKAARIATSLKSALGQRTASAVVSAPGPLPKPLPYKTTPVFDQATLPNGLRRNHRTAEGVWGVIRVLDGGLRLHLTATDESVDLSPHRPGIVQPGQIHWVEPVGPMRMQVEFYNVLPHA